MNGAITGISNIMLAVRDMERSVAFFRDALGLAVRVASPELTFLRAGAVTLCLRHAPGDAASSDDSRVEIVFDVEDIHAAHATLAGRGVRFRVAPRVVTGNFWAADFRDPDGNVLSIFGPAAAPAAGQPQQP